MADFVFEDKLKVSWTRPVFYIIPLKKKLSEINELFNNYPALLEFYSTAHVILPLV